MDTVERQSKAFLVCESMKSDLTYSMSQMRNLLKYPPQHVDVNRLEMLKALSLVSEALKKLDTAIIYYAEV